jgi:hypothetical protein
MRKHQAIALALLLSGCGLPPGVLIPPPEAPRRVHRLVIGHTFTLPAPKPERIFAAPKVRAPRIVKYVAPTTPPPAPSAPVAHVPTWADVEKDNDAGKAAIEAAIKLGNGHLPGEKP